MPGNAKQVDVILWIDIQFPNPSRDLGYHARIFSDIENALVHTEAEDYLARIRIGTQCLANMITGNPDTQSTLWDFLFSDGGDRDLVFRWVGDYRTHLTCISPHASKLTVHPDSKIHSAALVLLLNLMHESPVRWYDIHPAPMD